MPEKNVSPEKRLLRIIEGQPQASVRPTPGQFGKKYFSLSSVQGRLAFLRDRWKKRKTVAGRPADAAVDVRYVNAALQVAIALVAVWLVISGSLEYRRVQQVGTLELQALPASAQAASAEVASLIQPLQAYLDRVAARDIFSLADTAQEKVAAAFQEKPENARVKELAATLKLVGISWSDAPDAIIEDSKAQRSYFVKQGAQVGEFTVHKILKDRVILKYFNEEVELR